MKASEKEKQCWLIVLGLSLCLTLQAQVQSELAYRRYTTQDGLPQMQTERLWQDSHGYIYIGTLSGFVRFDGRSLTPLLKGRRENIVGFTETEGRVSGLGFRRQWLINDNNVVMQPIDKSERWQLNNLNAGGLPDGYVLLEDEQEKHRRLCRTTKERFVPVLVSGLLDEMTPDRKVYRDSLCTMIPTERGVFQVMHGEHHAARLTEKGNIYTLFRTDTAMLAFAPDGIYNIRCERTKEQKHSKAVMKQTLAVDWPEASFGLTVKKLRSGALIIADEHSVYCYEDGRIRKIATGMNLIRDVLIDRWDRLWVATYQGVYCFFNSSFTNYRLTDENDIVRGIAYDSHDRLLMGTLNGKLLVGIPPYSPSDNSSLTWKQAPGISIFDDDASQYYGTSAVTIGNRIFIPSHNDVTCVECTEPSPLIHGQLPKQRTLNLPQDRFRFLTEHDGRLILVSQKGVIAAYDPETEQIDTLTTEIPFPWCVAFDTMRDGYGPEARWACIASRSKERLRTGELCLGTRGTRRPAEGRFQTPWRTNE